MWRIDNQAMCRFDDCGLFLQEPPFYTKALMASSRRFNDISGHSAVNKMLLSSCSWTSTLLPEQGHGFCA